MIFLKVPGYVFKAADFYAGTSKTKLKHIPYVRMRSNSSTNNVAFSNILRDFFGIIINTIINDRARVLLTKNARNYIEVNYVAHPNACLQLEIRGLDIQIVGNGGFVLLLVTPLRRIPMWLSNYFSKLFHNNINNGMNYYQQEDVEYTELIPKLQEQYYPLYTKQELKDIICVGLKRLLSVARRSPILIFDRKHNHSSILFGWDLIPPNNIIDVIRLHARKQHYVDKWSNIKHSKYVYYFALIDKHNKIFQELSRLPLDVPIVRNYKTLLKLSKKWTIYKVVDTCDLGYFSLSHNLSSDSIIIKLT